MWITYIHIIFDKTCEFYVQVISWCVTMTAITDTIKALRRVKKSFSLYNITIIIQVLKAIFPESISKD